MPLILVQNETTVHEQYERWKDIEGEQYHFPNQYKNRIQEGEQFIYYRGVRRAGNTRAVPEYFGFGRVGKKWIDTESLGDGETSRPEWFCEILDYIPFINPVPFRINNQLFENIPQNLWSVGVRVITQEVFDRILAAAGIIETVDNDTTKVERAIANIDDVTPQLVSAGESLIVPALKEVDGVIAESLAYPLSPRYSKYSKLYGDRAEEIVFKLLTARAEHKLTWPAREGRKPGWDIEYYNQGAEIAVEVKGTSGKRFRNLEITAGEWKAAEDKRENYNLYLVADCLGEKPMVQVISNPYELYLNKKISLMPTGYRMAFNVTLS